MSFALVRRDKPNHAKQKARSPILESGLWFKERPHFNATKKGRATDINLANHLQ
jgi:hypothetical protein